MNIEIHGAGLIGLATAWYLDGHHVTIVDVPKPGAASRASAGMLAPFAEAKSPGPMLDLGVASLREWPHFASAIGVALHGPGMLRFGAADAVIDWVVSRGYGEVVDAQSLEPNVIPGKALFTPDEKNVDPPAVVGALIDALRARGVRFVDAPRGADVTVLATGAWTEPYSFPVRGQVAAVRSNAVTATIYAPGTYLVPRDGRIILGATEEHVGFDMTVTAAEELKTKAAKLVPEIASAELLDAWCGFRPGTKDGLPMIGRVDDRTYVATGHYRNGILLAPITGKLLAEEITTGNVPELLRPCDPAR